VLTSTWVDQGPIHGWLRAAVHAFSASTEMCHWKALLAMGVVVALRGNTPTSKRVGDNNMASIPYAAIIEHARLVAVNANWTTPAGLHPVIPAEDIGDSAYRIVHLLYLDYCVPPLPKGKIKKQQ